MSAAGHPLDGVGVFLLFITLHVLEHLPESIHLVGGAFGMKEERLAVARVDRDQVEFHRSLECAELENQVSRAETEVVLDLLLYFGSLHMRIARRLNHCTFVFCLKTPGKREKFQEKTKIGKRLAMKKLEHIGIAVRNLEESNRLFARLLGTEPYKTEAVGREGVKTSFFKVGDVKIELLEATRPDSAIASFIEKRGEGIHHLAFDVDSVSQKIEEMTAAGFKALADKPMPGADNKLIAFLHPKSTNSVLVELCQDK